MYARLCFETPRTSGSLEKTGMDDFLKLRHAGKLGHGMISSSLAVHANLPFRGSPHDCRFHQI
jgi:hypothetical protein